MYELTTAGHEQLHDLNDQWQAFMTAVDTLGHPDPAATSDSAPQAMT